MQSSPPADTPRPCSVRTALRGWTVPPAECGTAPASSTVRGGNPIPLPLRNLPPPPSLAALNASPWALTGGQTDAGAAFRAGGDVTGERGRSRGSGRERQEGGPEPPGCPGDGSQLSHFSDSGRQPKTAGCAGAGGARGPRTAVRTVEGGSVSAATAGGRGQRGRSRTGLPAPAWALGTQRSRSSVPPAGGR